jgi:hypothetical protein
MKARFLISLLIGCASGLLCWLIHLGPDPNDFAWSLQATRFLISGRDPYAAAFSAARGTYPITVAPFALPFLWAGPQLAGALFFGVSSALLAFGLSRSSYTRLLIFCAFPYWMAMLCVQWSPLVMAAALFSWLLPATLAKPQIGLPIGLTHLSRSGVIASAALGVASLLWMPDWPVHWLSHIDWPHFVPMFVLPLGPALILGLWCRRDPDAHLLLLTSLTPQHWFYDGFILWLIPKSRREILATCLLSWGAGMWRILHTPRTRAEFGVAAVAWIYLPMLAIVIWRYAAARSWLGSIEVADTFAASSYTE